MAAHSFILASHQSPDGDTLGSALALAHVLRQCGKDVIVICEDAVPENYEFIPESDTVLTHTDSRGFDVGVLVDLEGIKRAGSAGEAVTSSKTTACIDHHVRDEAFGEIKIVNSDASSTAEVLVDLLDANDVQIDDIVATQLMTGIVADTGGFRFPNASPHTFRIAARLVELGANPSEIAREVYNNRPLRAAKLLGKALDSLRTDPSGFVVWASITRSDMQELGATEADTDSIVNSVGAVKGPRVAVLFRETEPKSIRISLRSKGGVDVNRIARVFDGGGHVAASGCTIEASLDQAREMVIAEVLKWTES